MGILFAGNIVRALQSAKAAKAAGRAAKAAGKAAKKGKKPINAPPGAAADNIPGVGRRVGPAPGPAADDFMDVADYVEVAPAAAAVAKTGLRGRRAAKKAAEAGRAKALEDATVAAKDLTRTMKEFGPQKRGLGLRGSLAVGGLGAGAGMALSDNTVGEAAELRVAYERSDPTGRAHIMADVYLRDNPAAMEHMMQAMGTDDPAKVLAMVSRTMVNTMRRGGVDGTQLGPDDYMKLAEMAAGGIPQ